MTDPTPELTEAELVALEDRLWCSRFSTLAVADTVWIGGVPTDPDNQLVTVARMDQGGDVIDTREAVRIATGVYEIILSSFDTASQGLYSLRWQYNVAGTPTYDVIFVEVGPRSPDYDRLDPSMLPILSAVEVRFADLIDSPIGGPNLATYVQANWSRNRLAQLLTQAVSKLSALSAPHADYSSDGVDAALFPVKQWGGLLTEYAYVEVVRHLRRSYVEIPAKDGISVATLDRRDYMDRWAQILHDALEEIKPMVDQWKIAHMGLGAPHVMVAGGVYGRSNPSPTVVYNPARVPQWRRMY